MTVPAAQVLRASGVVSALVGESKGLPWGVPSVEKNCQELVSVTPGGWQWVGRVEVGGQTPTAGRRSAWPEGEALPVPGLAEG